VAYQTCNMCQILCPQCVNPFKPNKDRRKFCSRKCLTDWNNSPERFMQLVDKTAHCWFWKGAVHHSGYGSFNLNGQKRIAHTVAFEFFVGPIPAGKMVCHKCDVRLCVNPNHLFPGTAQDNVDDMVKKGRHRHGSKLTNEQARSIRFDRRSEKVIAKQFKISKNQVGRIRRCEAWKELDSESTALEARKDTLSQ